MSKIKKKKTSSQKHLPPPVTLKLAEMVRSDQQGIINHLVQTAHLVDEEAQAGRRKVIH